MCGCEAGGIKIQRVVSQWECYEQDTVLQEPGEGLGPSVLLGFTSSHTSLCLWGNRWASILWSAPHPVILPHGIHHTPSGTLLLGRVCLKPVIGNAIQSWPP